MLRNFFHLYIIATCLIVLTSTAYSQVHIDHGRLKVATDKHSLQYEDGSPFFWLGDTGWGLFQFLSIKEITRYLDNRVAKGFNVIQAVAIFAGNGTGEPNFYGNKAITGLHPLRTNEKYFTLIDTVMKMAQQRNLIIALLPVWGDDIVRSWGDGSRASDSVNAYTMGSFLGRRYKNYKNIVWMMGGDRPAQTDSFDARYIWRAMAKGIIDATHHECLITYHPNGYQSSGQWLQNEPWLDFNMIQSSHGEHDMPNWASVKKDWEALPTKPTLDGECNYEDHPVAPWPKWNADSGYFRDYDVRKQLYRSVFAGGLGVTYGHHAIWQFVNEKSEIINYADRGWVNAMDRPGAYEAGYLRRLIESYHSLARIPDLSIIAEGQGNTNATHIEAFREKDNAFAMVYLPVGKAITINTDFLTTAFINASWFNPKDGKKTMAGKMIQRKAKMQFTPPTTGTGNDWVLIIEH